MELNIKTFPAGFNASSDKKSISAEIYGNRFCADQTLYEYLIEFLLIFVSADDDPVNPKRETTVFFTRCYWQSSLYS